MDFIPQVAGILEIGSISYNILSLHDSSQIFDSNVEVPSLMTLDQQSIDSQMTLSAFNDGVNTVTLSSTPTTNSITPNSITTNLMTTKNNSITTNSVTFNSTNTNSQSSNFQYHANSPFNQFYSNLTNNQLTSNSTCIDNFNQTKVLSVPYFDAEDDFESLHNYYNKNTDIEKFEINKLKSNLETMREISEGNVSKTLKPSNESI